MGLSWSWSYCSWIYNYLCNQFLSPLMLWVQIPLRWGALDTTLCDKVCQWLATGRWFSPPIKLTAQYSWNIVESGIKHHNHNQKTIMKVEGTMVLNNLSHTKTTKIIPYLGGGATNSTLHTRQTLIYVSIS